MKYEWESDCIHENMNYGQSNKRKELTLKEEYKIKVNK